MADAPQSYDNHTRWHAPFHYFAAPVMVTNFIVALVLLIREPGLERGWWVVVSAALVAVTGVARMNPLKVQDRVIRLEESLRYYQLLPDELAQRAASLTPAQVVALRFASDEELEGLVREVLDGRLVTPDEIKRAVRNWRPDTFRV